MQNSDSDQAPGGCGHRQAPAVYRTLGQVLDGQPQAGASSPTLRGAGPCVLQPARSLPRGTLQQARVAWAD